MITGNKGDWSEIYALFKIISDKNLFAGDSDLNRIQNLFFPIIKILREESNGSYEYLYDNDIVIVRNEVEEFRIPIIVFHQQTAFLLSKLKETSVSASFAIPEVEEFINSYNSNSLKARSSAKSDIRIVIYDQRVGVSSEMGFSIKSQIGGAATLLNAGRTTNFIFSIERAEFTEDQVELINSISTSSKIKDRIGKIEELGGVLKFQKTESDIFGNNLTLIDSSLSLILAELVYLFFTSSNSKVKDLVSVVTINNPLGYNNDTNHPFYTYKIKRFLTDIALGMMPSQVWTGELDATGGYLVVKNDGEVLCYHIYNRNEFEEYLLENTKLETASSRRHVFGKIYKVEDKLFFNLNLQIRFRR